MRRRGDVPSHSSTMPLPPQIGRSIAVASNSYQVVEPFSQPSSTRFLIAHRLRAAAVALRTSRTPVGRVALDAGFADLSHFTASFALAFGTSPGAYRRRGTRGGC